MKTTSVFGVIIGFIPLVYSIYVFILMQQSPLSFPASLAPSLFLDIIGFLIIDLALEDKIKNYVEKKIQITLF